MTHQVLYPALAYVPLKLTVAANSKVLGWQQSVDPPPPTRRKQDAAVLVVPPRPVPTGWRQPDTFPNSQPPRADCSMLAPTLQGTKPAALNWFAANGDTFQVPLRQQFDGPASIILAPMPSAPPPVQTGGGGKKRPHLEAFAPHPGHDDTPRKPVRPIWDRRKALEEYAKRPKPATPPPAGPPALPPLGIFKAAAPASTPGNLNLPNFADLVPQSDQIAMHRQLQEAQDQADIAAALRALGINLKQ